MARTWSTFNAPPQWGKMTGIPADFSDGKINWTEVQGKPVAFPPMPHGHSFGEISNIPFTVLNWSIVVPRNFIANTYQDLGTIPLNLDLDKPATQHAVYIFQFNIQYGGNYSQIMGSSNPISAISWLYHPLERIEREVFCEGHFFMNSTLTFYLSEGQETRNLFMKINRDISISSSGGINIKIISIN